MNVSSRFLDITFYAGYITTHGSASPIVPPVSIGLSGLTRGYYSASLMTVNNANLIHCMKEGTQGHLLPTTVFPGLM